MKFSVAHDSARVETDQGMDVVLTAVGTGRRVTPGDVNSMRHGTRVLVEVRTADDRFSLSITKFENSEGVDIGVPPNLIMMMLENDQLMEELFADPKFAQRFKALMLIHLDKLNGA